MTALNVFLVPRSSNFPDYGDAEAAGVAQHVAAFFKDVCAGNKPFDGVRMARSAVPAQVGPKDLLCYIVSDPDRGLVKKKNGGVAPNAAGATLFSASDATVISEIYLSRCAGDANRVRLIANLILHELMHNKLDAMPGAGRVRDVHTISNGSVSKGTINASSTPSAADVAAMRAGIGRAVPQYTGGL